MLFIKRQESKTLQLEILMYSRHLRRVSSSKFIGTFDEYEDENNIIEQDISSLAKRNAVSKLPKVVRRLSSNKYKTSCLIFYDLKFHIFSKKKITQFVQICTIMDEIIIELA